MAERTIHQFPPGEYTRVSLDVDLRLGLDPQRSLAYVLVNRGLSNAGVVLCRMTLQDLRALAAALDVEIALR